MESSTDNIHLGLTLPPDAQPGSDALIQGSYQYYHYGCDGVDDRGWGCGYRTLQTLCSWVRSWRSRKPDSKPAAVPSLPQIQDILVAMADKPRTFAGSKDWLGSIEVGLVIDSLYNVPCKIMHISSGRDLHKHIDELERHFKEIGAPVMMGGDTDASSKGIIGICRGDTNTYLLILDPHYYGCKPNRQTLEEKRMLVWRPLESFLADSFYNLCLPQAKTR